MKENLSINFNEYKERFINIYTAFIKRDGSSDLLKWLINETDFFVAPASTKYHGSYKGGLCLHSINVFEEIGRLCRAYPEININNESLAIVSLLHDLCKVNTYELVMKNVKEEGTWKQVPSYLYNEKFVFGGHGTKSLYLINKYIKLSDEEAVAIVSHMGFSDTSINPSTISKIFTSNKLAWILHVADESATYVREKE